MVFRNLPQLIPLRSMRNAMIFSPAILLLAPLSVMAAAPVASDSALANGDLDGVAILDDAPYENVANPGAPVRSGWKLFSGYSRSEGAKSDLSSSLWTTSVAKSWYLGAWTPKLKASWSTHDATEASASSGTFLAGMDWAPLEVGSFSVQGSWTTQDGPDEPTATVGTDWEFNLSEWATMGLEGSGGWSQSADWDGHVGSSLGFGGERFELNLGGGWDYRKVEFVTLSGVSSTDYQNVWSSTAELLLHWGNWSTGPSWSLEYWKATLPERSLKTRKSGDELAVLGRAMTSSNSNGNSEQGSGGGQSQGSHKMLIISEDGSSLSQEVSWNLAWAPLRGWSLDLAGFRTFGESQLSLKESSESTSKSRKFGQANSQGNQKATQTSYTPTPESWGGRVSLSVGW